MSVKVYKINWQDGDYNSFVGEVISRTDYEKLEARCKELEAKIELQRENSIESSRNFEANFGHLKNHYESENRILKAQLEKCKEQRDTYCSDAYNSKYYADYIQQDDKELDSITIDSIKRGE